MTFNVDPPGYLKLDGGLFYDRLKRYYGLWLMQQCEKQEPTRINTQLALGAALQ